MTRPVACLLPALLSAALIAPAVAQEPPTLEGVVGCIVTWNYPADQEPLVAAFPFIVDGVWRYGAPADARSVTCDRLGMTAPGQYRLELSARAKPDVLRGNSPKVAFLVTLSPAKGPSVSEPTEIKLVRPAPPAKP